MSYAATRLNNVQESVIRSITRHALEKGAILLAQGFPDFDPPAEVLAAAENALRQGWNQYSMPWGLPGLRQAIADKTMRFYGQKVEPEHVTVTCGVTEALLSAIFGIVNPGEKVLIIEPAHETYHAAIMLAGGVPAWIAIRPPNFLLDPDELRAAFRNRLKAVILNTPHNPSGRVFTREELSWIANLCQEFDVIAITDEIYEHMIYDGREHIPLASFPGMWDRTITISGMGKTFAATGWRLGYAIAPAELTNALRKVHDFATACAPTPFQAAMITALSLPDTYFQELRAFYTSRRARMMKILDDYGFAANRPEGAYYTMADFRGLGRGDDDTQFSYWLIDEVGVAVVPGSSFYLSNPVLGRGTVRFSFPKKDETLDRVEERFKKCL